MQDDIDDCTFQTILPNADGFAIGERLRYPILLSTRITGSFPTSHSEQTLTISSNKYYSTDVNMERIQMQE